ncbi:PKD domain-containing protein, partial [Candidatus Bipolaricaulota bacterium]|nr:PKD domain-containing protein [Candidatus Bipolaricaulota bacterium]
GPKEVAMFKPRGAFAALFLLGGLVLVTGCFLFANRPPVAAFAVKYNVTADPLVVEFDASTSSDPDGDAIAQYKWTFGDDVQILSPLEFSATVYVPQVLVRYPVEGTYKVQLLVYDEQNAASENVATIDVVVPSVPVIPMP